MEEEPNSDYIGVIIKSQIYELYELYYMNHILIFDDALYIYIIITEFVAKIPTFKTQIITFFVGNFPATEVPAVASRKKRPAAVDCCFLAKKHGCGTGMLESERI